jgi:transmembrane sensor
MKNYNKYSVEDFVQDQRFRAWVRKPSKEEDLFWEQWLVAHAHMRQTLDEARAIVLSIHPLNSENISDIEIDSEIHNILSQIDDQQLDEHEAEQRHPQWQWLKVAASVAILSMCGWYGWNYFAEPANTIEQSSENYMIEQVNKSGKALLINLPDNSSVLLSQNCLIRYPHEFKGNTREVFVSGTAFFEVTKDKTKPFYVEAGDVIARVLGTSFEVNTSSQRQTRIVVRSGSVSVYSKSSQKGNEKQPDIILGKDDQLIVKDGVNEVQRTRLNSNSLSQLQIPDTHLRFDETPVSDAFARLSKVYGITIDYSEASIRNCSVTASFTDEPFNLKLDLICRSIGVEYQINSDGVTVTGKGCKTD